MTPSLPHSRRKLWRVLFHDGSSRSSSSARRAPAPRPFSCQHKPFFPSSLPPFPLLDAHNYIPFWPCECLSDLCCRCLIPPLFSLLPLSEHFSSFEGNISRGLRESFFLLFRLPSLVFFFFFSPNHVVVLSPLSIASMEQNTFSPLCLSR